MKSIDWAKIRWNEAGIPTSVRYEDVYFSSHGVREETEHVFIKGNHLRKRWKDIPDFRIGELGFGTASVFLATWLAWLESAPAGAKLQYLSFEQEPLSPLDLEKVPLPEPKLAELKSKLLAVYPHRVEGIHRRTFKDLATGKLLVLTLVFGDAREWISKLVPPRSGFADAWFLHGFAPSKNPELWDPQLLQNLAGLSRPGCTLSSFSVASEVRASALSAGFRCEKQPGFAGKKEMLFGELEKTSPKTPIPPWFALPHSSSPTDPIAIIGAGLAGCSISARLALRGVHSQIFDEHEKIASGASGNPIGISMPFLSPEPDTKCRLQLAATLFLESMLRDLIPGWTPSGVIELPESEQDAPRLARALKGMGLPPEVCRELTLEQARQHLGLRSALLSPGPAIWHRIGSWISPQALCRAYLESDAVHSTFTPSHRITKIERKGDEGWRLSTRSGPNSISANRVIFANAKDANALGFMDFLTLVPVRGQIAYLRRTPELEELLVPLVSDVYVTPSVDGIQSLGATFERGEDSAAFKIEDNQALISRLQILFPELSIRLAEEGRASVRTYTPDALPHCGPVVDPSAFTQQFREVKKGYSSHHFEDSLVLPGLFCSLAFGSRGISTSALAAETLASLLTEELLPIEADLFAAIHPSRSILRKLQKP